MHVCDEFRERITEQILDRQNIEQDPDVRLELLGCSSCSDFYTQSRDMVEAFSTVHFEIPETQWESMQARLNSRIRAEHTAKARTLWHSWFGYAPVLAAVAMLLVSVAVYRFAVPKVNPIKPLNSGPATIAAADPTLDPVTIEFLEQSELLLRSVMKLQPAAADDLQEARRIADKQLIALDQRKQAAADLKPAVNVMDKYETVLRDIRNLKPQSAADDIADIKNRIEKNGLIENMKSLQPKPQVVDTDLER